MKKTQRFRRICLLLLLTLSGLSALHAQSYDKLWKQVEQAQEKSLPQTVIKLTGEIYRKAERERNVPQMLKASLCRDDHQQTLTPDSLYSALERMEHWAQTEQNPVTKAILHSLLASRYARFMQSNRYALQQRTLLDEETFPRDIRTWSAHQFISKIDMHSLASLQDSLRLMETSSATYLPFIIQGDGSRFYRHDLYHLLAKRAISSYDNQSRYGLDPFGLDSLMDTRINDIYERMINAYSHRPGSKDALLLCRLDYWNRKENHKEYLPTLDALIREFGERQLCAEVYIKKASWLRANSSMAEALKVCDEGLKRYPSYKRIHELKNIRESILQPRLSVYTSGSGYPGDSVRLNVGFCNLKGFTLNLYATTLDEVPRKEYEINQDTYRKYARKLSSTHFDLQPLPGKGKRPEDIPYLSTDTVFTFNIPQETGVYIMQVVPDAGTTTTADLFLVSTRFKVLTLSLGEARTEVITLDARSGKPIADARVSFYSYDIRNNPKPLAEVSTDVAGKAIIPWQEGIGYYVARKDKDRAMMPQSVYLDQTYAYNRDAIRRNVTLLTDRSLYRPGQAVYVKGVVYNQSRDSASVCEGADYNLVLLDANRKELETKPVRTNEFGSFTTEFMLPAACLNGQFSIEAIRTGTSSGSFGVEGTNWFRVEEYKRPTFEITFNPVSEAYRAGDSIVLKGNVKAFNGRTVQDVPLAYTVVLGNRLPGFWQRPAKPLLSDTLQLDANGDFTIPLTLDNPPGNTGRYGYSYTYQIEAAVTDQAGETQTTSYNLAISSKAYSFNASIPQSVCKEDSLFFTFGVCNGMNIPQQLKGTYRLYPLASLNENIGNTPKQPAFEGTFTANQQQDFSAWSKLPSGVYQLELSVRDSLGREETFKGNVGYRFLLFSKTDKRPAVFSDLFYYAEDETFDAQHPAAFLAGTSHKDVHLLINVLCNGKRIESHALQLSDTIIRMEYPYKEMYGEGATVVLSFVKDGKVYERQIILNKRKPVRTLDVKWEVFRDRLRPGQEEEWKLVVKTPQGMPAAAEMLATMYDASLDKIYSHSQLLRVFYPTYSYYVSRSESNHSFYSLMLDFPLKFKSVPGWNFDRFYSSYPESKEWELSEVVVSGGMTKALTLTASLQMRTASNNAVSSATIQESAVKYKMNDTVQEVAETNAPPQPDAGETLQPFAGLRTNFAETAFFYPQLRTNKQGEIVFSFTMPQSLTRWNFRGYAHTKDMMTGMLNAATVTAKEFMLTPNMPRFVRTGDKTQIAASVANLTGKPVKGTATLTLFDPVTEKVISTQRQKFAAEAGKTTAVTFHFEATDRYDLLGVRIIADGGAFSDGEQHLLPVLSNKEYITETLAMPVRGKETRVFRLDSLFNRNALTATDRRLTVEFTGNPAWYAVQSLPVLSLPSTENSISWATVYYANSLAGYIANSQPRIKTVFDSWKLSGGTKETFLSQLEKNQDVKNILLEESPWLLEAKTEAEQQARIATLFDINQLNGRNQSAFTKLKELQGEDGAWSWYKGMPGSRSITSYIAGLLIRLPLLTADALPAEVVEMKRQAMNYLNKEALTEYLELRKTEKNGAKHPVLSDAAMEYLYLTALGKEEVPSANKEAYRYFLAKVGNNLTGGSMVRKAQSAIILKAAGRTDEASGFIASIKEHLMQTDEMGAHFAFHDTPYNWGMLPVPAHVEVMEALHFTGGNDALLEEMKLWLLKQKQTTGWNSPVATADAVYALLCQGSNLLESRGDVRITLGKKVLETTSPGKASIPGLNYIKESFGQDSPVLKAQSVTIEKRDAGIAWGAVYAQYLSPMSDVKQQGGELNVEKKLYVERVAANGKKSLQPVADAARLAVGDKVVSRLTIRLDRAMDFVQLKDRRGACFEPAGTLSGYRWSSGFGYYVEVEDAATNFFFDHLGKGVYILEHSYRIARAGTYETGLATMQSAYAPEYASHSTGGTVVIK